MLCAEKQVPLTSLEHLIASIFRCDWLMAPFTTYFDDSGTHLQANTAIAARYVSSVEKWKLFEKDWRAIADSEGFQTFHMADFVAQKDDFSSWSDHKRRHVIRKLCAAINIRIRAGIVAAIRKRDYDDTVIGAFRKYCGEQHYTFVLRTCMTGLRGWRDQFEPTCTLQYVFDQMGKGKGEIMRVMDAAIETSRREAAGTGIAKLAGYSFQDKKAILPLQAADILAWSFFQYSQFLTVKRPLHWIAREALDILQDANVMNSVRTREQLLAWANEEQKEIRKRGILS